MDRGHLLSSVALRHLRARLLLIWWPLKTPSDSRSVFRFGPFQLDLASGELHKHGVKLRMQEQPFQILVMLLQNPGEVVTRDELRNKLWSSDTFVDFDVGLNNAILRLRNALGDSADSPRFIETLPRRGYRFIAQVHAPVVAQVHEFAQPSTAGCQQEAVASPASTTNQVVQPPLEWFRARRTWTVGLGLAVLALFAGLNVGGWRQRVFGRPVAPAIRSLAVLPLENLSGDEAQQYFADGMTDELITDLASIASLRIISRTSTRQYKGTKKTIPEIARELNVDAVVEGSVGRSDNKVRIRAQLVRAAPEEHLWAESYERNLPDVLALQRDVAKAISNEIRVHLTPQERQHLANVRPVKPEAYDYYLRGHLYSYRESSTDNEVAIGMLERAIALDSDFAPAYAELADAYRVRFTQFAPQEKQWEEKAFQAADKALSLDPALAEAYVARGFLLWTPSKGFQHKEAIQNYRHALSLNPNLDEAQHYLGNIYIHIGLLDEGMAELQRAVALNPSNGPARARIGAALLYQGKCEQALAIFQSNLWEANQTLRGYQIAWSLFCLGRTQEAFATIDEYLKKYPADEGGLLSSTQALLYAATRQSRLAEVQIQQAQKGRDFIHFHHTAYNIAAAYALMHKDGPAIQWLQRAAIEGFPCYPVFARDPNLASLRTDPRFVQFIADQKKQWESYKAAL